jgi:hypothetical protein
MKKTVAPRELADADWPAPQVGVVMVVMAVWI